MADNVLTNKGRFNMLHRWITGTPTQASPTKFGIGTGTTDPELTDTALQTPITAWSGGANVKSFDSGYPTATESTLETQFQGTVNTTEANSNNISEVSIENVDTTIKMMQRSTFTAISKTSSDEIVWSAKIRITN